MEMAREANNFLAELVRQHPTRYAGFGTVPLQDPEAGADELERAMRQLGLKGVKTFGHTNGKYLDDDRFRPFWERAEALDAPVYLHAADAWRNAALLLKL
jgi:2,3-dihydroxybenzoate decarboxylase